MAQAFKVALVQEDGTILRTWGAGGLAEDAARRVQHTQVTRYRRNPASVQVLDRGAARGVEWAAR